jgi:hypothetical protein
MLAATAGATTARVQRVAPPATAAAAEGAPAETAPAPKATATAAAAAHAACRGSQAKASRGDMWLGKVPAVQIPASKSAQRAALSNYGLIPVPRLAQSAGRPGSCAAGTAADGVQRA